jgi:hypothetical protein
MVIKGIDQTFHFRYTGIQTRETDQREGEHTATTANVTTRRLDVIHAHHSVTLYEMRYQHNRLGQCHGKVEVCKKLAPEVNGISSREVVARFVTPQKL